VKSPENAAMTVDVDVDVTEVAIRLRGDVVYSQSVRTGVAGIDTGELLEAVLVAQRRVPSEVAGTLIKTGILLRSVSPLKGFEVVLRERTGLPVTIASWR
jgi:actin-like ATPase involved in cell morphogenesis